MAGRLDEAFVADPFGDLRDAVARDDELADRVHERVETPRVDADMARAFLGLRGGRGFLALRDREFRRECLRELVARFANTGDHISGFQRLRRWARREIHRFLQRVDPGE